MLTKMGTKTALTCIGQNPYSNLVERFLKVIQIQNLKQDHVTTDEQTDKFWVHTGLKVLAFRGLS